MYASSGTLTFSQHINVLLLGQSCLWQYIIHTKTINLSLFLVLDLFPQQHCIYISLEVHMNFLHIKTLDFNFGFVHVQMKGKVLTDEWMEYSRTIRSNDRTNATFSWVHLLRCGTYVSDLITVWVNLLVLCSWKPFGTNYFPWL